MMDSLSKIEKGLYKNFPFPGMFLIISAYGNRLVTLHLPPPDILSLRPRPFFFQW